MAPGASLPNRWSNLQDDLLESVVTRLSFGDLIRFSFVCRSWKSFITTRSSSLLSPKPHLWIILPDRSGHLTLRNIYNDRVYVVEAPELFGHKICGSCFGGWLITTNLYGRIQVFHPFSKTLIHLPPVFMIPGVRVDYCRDGDCIRYHYKPDVCVGCWESYRPFMRDFFVYKVMLSNDRRYAVAIYGFSRRMGFCRIGKDERWIDLIVPGKDTWMFQDVIFYQGKFFAVHESGDVFVISGIQTEAPFLKQVMCSSPSYKEDHEYNSKDYYVKYYLVESLLGKMMLIKRIRFCEGEYKTVAFRVAKLDVDKWVRVEDFGNDSSFFVGNYSFSISNSVLPKCYDRTQNYIFFTDDFVECLRKHVYDDFGEFDLRNGTFQTWKWKQGSLIHPPQSGSQHLRRRYEVLLSCCSTHKER